jgi:hypothetical protein
MTQKAALFCPPLYLAGQVMVPSPLTCISRPHLTSIIDFSLKYVKLPYPPCVSAIRRPAASH